jgi:hypothetical protein
MESTSYGKKTTTLLILMGLLFAITIAIVSANGGVHGISRNHTGYHDPGDGYGYSFGKGHDGDGHGNGYGNGYGNIGKGNGYGNGYRNRGIGNGNGNVGNGNGNGNGY